MPRALRAPQPDRKETAGPARVARGPGGQPDTTTPHGEPPQICGDSSLVSRKLCTRLAFAAVIYITNWATRQRPALRLPSASVGKRDDLASVMAHDLAEPLRVIAHYAERLPSDLDAEGRDAVDGIRAAARRLAVLVDSLADYARAGGRRLERHPWRSTACSTRRSPISSLHSRSPGWRSSGALCRGSRRTGSSSCACSRT